MPLSEADDLFAQRKYDEALEHYRACGETVEALAQVARCLSLTKRLDEGRGWLERASTLATANEPQGWSRYLGVRGIFERDSGDKAKAKATFEEMHAYCVNKELWRRAVDAIHHIAIVVPPDEQPRWALLGIAAAGKLKDDGWLGVLWNNLGATYEDLKQYDKMLDAYTKARRFHVKANNPRPYVADWTLGHAYRLLGQMAEAQDWLEKSLTGAQEKSDKEWIGWSRKDLAETLTGPLDKPKRIAMLTEARALLVECGIGNWSPEGLKQIDQSLSP